MSGGDTSGEYVQGKCPDPALPVTPDVGSLISRDRRMERRTDRLTEHNAERGLLAESHDYFNRLRRYRSRTYLLTYLLTYL